jgi:hypothetical protein
MSLKKLPQWHKIPYDTKYNIWCTYAIWVKNDALSRILWKYVTLDDDPHYLNKKEKKNACFGSKGDNYPKKPWRKVAFWNTLICATRLPSWMGGFITCKLPWDKIISQKIITLFINLYDDNHNKTIFLVFSFEGN